MLFQVRTELCLAGVVGTPKWEVPLEVPRWTGVIRINLYQADLLALPDTHKGFDPYVVAHWCGQKMQSTVVTTHLCCHCGPRCCAGSDDGAGAAGVASFATDRGMRGA